MKPSVVVGNDVVDILDPRTEGKAEDARFLARVLHDDERDEVLAAADPHGALWARWAAKEAAYKVAAKVRGAPPTFVHRAFVTRAGAGADPEHVEHAGARYPVRLTKVEGALHAVAGSDAAALAAAVTGVERLDRPGAPWDAPQDELLARLTPAEAEAVHSRASAAVRLGARTALAHALGVDEARLAIVCAPGAAGRRPPRVLLDGRPGPADVSLSHHGGWIAWALVVR